MTRPVLTPVLNADGHQVGCQMFCPGCKTIHLVYTTVDLPEGNPVWGFNNDWEKPTFTPSILVTWDVGEERTKHVCHSYIRNGHWEYLNDCTHELRGLKIIMEPV